MDKDVIDYALESAAGKRVEYAEVRAHSEERTQLVVKNGVLDAYTFELDDGFSVRTLVDGGIGFASTNRWTREDARKIVDLAYGLSRTARRRDAITFTEEKSVTAEWYVAEKEKVADITPETRIKP